MGTLGGNGGNKGFPGPFFGSGPTRARVGRILVDSESRRGMDVGVPDARRWRSRTEGGKWLSEDAEPGMARGVAWERVGVEDAARLDAMMGVIGDVDSPATSHCMGACFGSREGIRPSCMQTADRVRDCFRARDVAAES